jgi:hypothetical protein
VRLVVGLVGSATLASGDGGKGRLGMLASSWMREG